MQGRGSPKHRTAACYGTQVEHTLNVRGCDAPPNLEQQNHISISLTITWSVGFDEERFIISWYPDQRYGMRDRWEQEFRWRETWEPAWGILNYDDVSEKW